MLVVFVLLLCLPVPLLWLSLLWWFLQLDLVTLFVVRVGRMLSFQLFLFVGRRVSNEWFVVAIVVLRRRRPLCCVCVLCCICIVCCFVDVCFCCLLMQIVLIFVFMLLFCCFALMYFGFTLFQFCCGFLLCCVVVFIGVFPWYVVCVSVACQVE